MQPKVLPVTCVPLRCVGLHPAHLPALNSLSPSLVLLAALSSKVIAISAVQSVRTSGVFVTTKFSFFAASRSIWLNPTPKLAIILAFLFSTESTSALIGSVTVGQTQS